MTVSEEEVWLLHKKPMGESSLLLSLFSPNGLIKAYFKGGKQAKTKTILQPFIPLWASIKNYTERSFVQKLEQAQAPLAFTGKMLFVGFYVNELIYQLIPPGEPFFKLYKSYVRTLTQLSELKQNKDIEMVLRRFEWCLLESCGYGLCLDKEALTQKDIYPDRSYRFTPGLGLVEDKAGFVGASVLDFLAGDDDCEACVLKTMKGIMRQAIDYALDGKKIHSRDLFSVYVG